MDVDTMILLALFVMAIVTAVVSVTGFFRGWKRDGNENGLFDGTVMIVISSDILIYFVMMIWVL